MRGANSASISSSENFIPMFAAVIALLVWQMENPQGFDVIWSLFGWSNQTLSVFTLWAITVYLAQQRKCYWITLLPALFMTVVCTTYILIGPEGFELSFTAGLAGGLTLMALFAAIFMKYKNTIK